MKTSACEIKETPILFSGAMVRALLEGRKTQTRRVVDIRKFGGPSETHSSRGRFICENGLWKSSAGRFNVWCDSRPCPYGVPGDRLWVKETFAVREDCIEASVKAKHYLRYRANGGNLEDEWHHYERWRPSLFMPRWASRITLEIVEVRVERLQEISTPEARAEGFPYDGPQLEGAVIRWYRALWDSLNGEKHPWESNPWVWAIAFRELVRRT